MITRRGFIAAMTAAPGMAKAKLSSAGIVQGHAVQTVEELVDAELTPMDMLRGKVCNQLYARRRKRDMGFNMPVSVETKKSWSPAFKHHVAMAEFIDPDSVWQMNPGEIYDLARKINLKLEDLM